MNVSHISLGHIPTIGTNGALILGTFDGVHLGHQLLINEAKKIADHINILLIYTNKKITKEHQTSGVLTTLDDRVHIFKKLGMNNIYLLNLGEELLKLSPEAFIENILVKMAPKYVIVGSDFRFGRGALGTPKLLSENTNFKTLVVTPLASENNKVSTSLIKKQLSAGHPDLAKDLLGSYYTLTGLVTRGFGLGNKLGYPTANIALDPAYFLPRHGVYLVRVILSDGVFFGMASLGFHPTVNEVKLPLLEVNIFDFQKDIYHAAIRVEFLKYLRPEFKFDTLDELVDQIKDDRAVCDKLIKEGDF